MASLSVRSTVPSILPLTKMSALPEISPLILMVAPTVAVEPEGLALIGVGALFGFFAGGRGV